MFNYGTIMDVILAKGRDVKYLEYCQGKSLDNFEHPYTINFKVANLIRRRGIDFKHSIFEIPYYHEFGCGTNEEAIYTMTIL